MRSKLIGLLLGLSLAAVVAPALACDYYHSTTATNDRASTEQTADTQPSTDTGAN